MRVGLFDADGGGGPKYAMAFLNPKGRGRVSRRQVLRSAAQSVRQNCTHRMATPAQRLGEATRCTRPAQRLGDVTVCGSMGPMGSPRIPTTTVREHMLDRGARSDGVF